MALTSDLVLKDNAAANHTFKENKRSGSRVERLDGATTLQLPTRLVIDHSTTGKDKSLAYRHLCQVAKTESDGNGGTATTIVNLTITVPANAPSTTAAKDAVAYLCDLVQDAGAANAAFDSLMQNQS